ncbi:predicted protein [Plenodomus lingam JN3]|uniref:Predicted protein n=1 Tax=Leptosphaeria maculans (strain JN3 / isolate v23.1.3 / race Av1-4-5-6-7-8) TaxID=985895 RepID=E5ABG6_LEPMJ|nr:predicted protein [Plenodomus lingam JN3]CBY01007.1 predicted protein [Plenodomus lingam JN3]
MLVPEQEALRLITTGEQKFNANAYENMSLDTIRVAGETPAFCIPSLTTHGFRFKILIIR